MKRVLFVALLMCCMFVLNACVSMPTKEQQEVRTIVSIKAPHDKVWKALVQTLMEEDYKIKTIDKDTGSIQTEDIVYSSLAAQEQLKKISYMPSMFLSTWNAYKYSLSILVSDTNTEAITLNIRATVAGYENNTTKGWIECYTNGTLEKSIINSVKKKLGIAEIQE